MIPKCENCKHRLDHPEGIICNKRLLFVDNDATCLDWENDELFNPTKLVALAIVAIGIVLILGKFL
jgi:hypothetical protein